MRKVKLADVFKKLSNLSGYEFFYDESVVQKYNMIDIDLDNVSFIDLDYLIIKVLFI